MSKENFLKSVIQEDVGRGDLFTIVSQPENIEAYIIAKSDGILAGREYIDELSNFYSIEFKWNFNDGDRFKTGDILVKIYAQNKILLSLERSILNITLHASSIATLTAKYIKKIKKTDVKLLDTRKTRPLLREFEKYSVRCGGGINHRLGLDDSLMLKDTHLKTIDDLNNFMKKARKKIPFTSKIEIECESFKQVKKAMKAGADIIMCDNMKNQKIKKVVTFRDKKFPHILIEASGNITLKTIKQVAKTGVDAISSGSIIHQANWIDLSMKVKNG